MGLLTVDRFKTLTILPSSWVDRVETDTPGFTLGSIESWSDHIYTRLRKRYGGTWGQNGAPVPGIIEKWINHLVTLDVDLKRGVSPNDEAFKIVKERAEAALLEITEAANSETGLLDLPLVDDGAASGISQGSPRFYSESSPYVYADEQGRVGHQQDRSRGGSGVT